MLALDNQGRPLPPKTLDLSKTRDLEVARALPVQDCAALDVATLLQLAKPLD